LLTVAAVVAVTSVINAVMPAISRTANALVSSADVADDRITSQIEIIHATGTVSESEATVWAKNTGASTILPLEKLDVFFGPEDAFQRVAYGGPSCTAPCWNYTLENDTSWAPTATLRITVYLTDPLTASTTYFVKIVAPNGVEDSKFFTL
jgi:hypothetical protein